MPNKNLLIFTLFFSLGAKALQQADVPLEKVNYGPEICATGTTVSGIDVSKYQPNINWATVRSAGRNFVFVKASEGNTLADANYAANIAGLSASKMTHGSYHYFTASDDPVKQADFFLSVTGKIAPEDLPPLLDWEDSNKIAPEIVIQRARAFLDRVESITGKIPIIYTYPEYWATLSKTPANLKNIAQFARYPLFIADQSGDCPRVPVPWTHWMFWQTESNQEPGVVGKVDEDVFNGDLRTLKKLLEIPVSTDASL